MGFIHDGIIGKINPGFRIQESGFRERISNIEQGISNDEYCDG